MQLTAVQRTRLLTPLPRSSCPRWATDADDQAAKESGDNGAFLGVEFVLRASRVLVLTSNGANPTGQS